MPSFTTYVPLKEVDNITLENDTTNGLQVKNQGISSTQLGDLEKWELLETLTLTGAVHTSATLTAKKQYKIVLEQIQGSAATTDIFLQMNEDTGNNYSYRYASGSGIGNAGAQAGILLMRAGNTALSCAEAQIEGKTHA
ncbi:hypothetical protein GOV10_01025, partial [Candidatus Woesearchaeota archaeon]|nr:hypothetical protein [Candidatus Woesearchaeota archaeon]